MGVRERLKERKEKKAGEKERREGGKERGNGDVQTNFYFHNSIIGQFKEKEGVVWHLFSILLPI